MSIQALPADTCRLFGSTTLIATPVSLVKELVDNAIDAGATFIEVLVSPNTVDKVEVRDDGHGIALADLDALGRRGHTSKIRRFEDLETVGGTSLGFRGEGLASANTLGYATITTRTADDAVASTFRLAPNLGGVSTGSRKPASAPVGTTVSVTCLFSALPVRRKVAVQEAPKAVTAIKTLLCGYAMARPHLRMAFRVLQATVPAWYYRPMASSSTVEDNNGMRQAVLMLFGAEVARQCQEVIASTEDLLGGQSTLSQSLSRNSVRKAENFVFEACLPRPGVDLSKLKIGGFVSVDGRPLSARHLGITSKLFAIFHTGLGKSFRQTGQQHLRLRDVFIRLNIKCPAGSYDANVESSKTDVLFADEKLLCDAFESLCGKVYVATEQIRYQNGNGNLLSSTPVRTQAILSFSGSVRGGEEEAQHQTQALNHGSQQGIDSSPAQDNSKRIGTVSRGDSGQLPISQLSSMFTDAPTAGPRIRQSLRSTGRPIEYNFTTSRGRGARRGASTFPRHVTLSPLQRRGHRRSMPVRGLQTPPSSSPVEERRGRISQQGHNGPDDTELPGLASYDGLRQTTISFGDQARVRNRSPEVDQEQVAQNEPSVRDDAACNTSTPRGYSFMSAGELFRQGQVNTELSQSVDARPGRPNASPEQDQGTPLRRSAYTMRVDQQQLRRSSATFARNAKAWDEELEYLSPEMADISSIKDRLRAVITEWLAKTRAERKGTGEGPVQVEFYLRKSLKKKVLMIRDLGV